MRYNKLYSILFIILVISVHGEDLPLSYSKENTGKECKRAKLLEPANLKKVDTLPNPFEWTDGSG